MHARDKNDATTPLIQQPHKEAKDNTADKLADPASCIEAIENLIYKIFDKIYSHGNYTSAREYSAKKTKALKSLVDTFNNPVKQSNENNSTLINPSESLLEQLHQFYFSLLNDFFEIQANMLINQLGLSTELTSEVMNKIKNNETSEVEKLEIIEQLELAVITNKEIVKIEKSEDSLAEKFQQIKKVEAFSFSESNFTHIPNILTLIKNKIVKYIHFIRNEIENNNYEQQLTSLREHAIRSIEELQKLTEHKENNKETLLDELEKKQTEKELISFIEELRTRKNEANGSSREAAKNSQHHYTQRRYSPTFLNAQSPRDEQPDKKPYQSLWIRCFF